MAKIDEQIKTRLKNGKLKIIVHEKYLSISTVDKYNSIICMYSDIPYDRHEPIYVEGVIIDFKKLNFNKG